MAFMMVPRETPARSAACCGVSLVSAMTVTISDNFLIGMTLLQSPNLLAEVGKQLLNVACVTRDAALVQEPPEVGRNLGVICIAANFAL